MNNRKPFDKALYAQNDQKAKDVIAGYYEALGYLVARNPNKYSADLILLEKTVDGYYKEIALIEVEIRNSWSSKQWPKNWDYRIAYRKAKYQEQNDLPVVYHTLNSDCTTFVKFKGLLSEYETIKDSNKFVSDETFYSIQVQDNEDVDQIDLTVGF